MASENQIYIVYDNQIICCSDRPVRRSQADSASIDGMADYEEAENLASTIRIGSLSLELEELRSNVVGATAGPGGDLHQLKGRC